MKTEMKVPAVGESINEVVIAQWLKKDGDRVEMDETLCEMESEKATFELTAEVAGTLKIVAQEEETVEIGGLVCYIESDGEAAEDSTEETTEDKAPEGVTTTEGGHLEMSVPAVGESIAEVTLASWVKQNGDHVEMDEVIAEIESEKATFELTAEASGKLVTIAEEGDTLPIGALLCRIEKGEGAPVEASAPAQPVEAVAESGAVAGHPSPAAAKILAEKGISPASVNGTGVGGRITKEDAVKAEKTAVAAPKPASAPAPAKAAPAAAAASTPVPQQVEGREQERKRMTSLRKTVSRRLVEVKNQTAMLTTFNEVDMKPIMDLRKQYKEMFRDKYDVNLGFMSFFTKACTIALQEWPAVNAQIDGNDIVYNHFSDVSIAVSSPKGLVVPVIRNAEKMNFNQIEGEVVRLAKKAHDGKLTMDEMTGGTFTITNGGIFGSMLSTPIINAPQSAILGMHNIVERPVAINGEVKIRPIMYVALSYDHRIIDGRESVSFLKRVKELLEDPTRMLLGV
ncbi:dihydrolipoyllysine-residue succinyltransferase component of 2-oxoglutarate dehydrogenase complex [Fulvitalea axinellae]|uniref:Dihydrolipoyllysine-residue succinyltransferase component of 2-oxoglutarate dehydrogenase complex n=1 Tax=Fulvitalea axinellae TaxID=1182444 RepID=A0AAU9CT59_9BACT|nr:dihydrolipoyllysine-residue succinyltransferase component of 2-oxoglutarate dehydrogenase complex [Fulvitalea axinellae]